MGITLIFEAHGSMTGNTPAFEAFDPTVRHAGGALARTEKTKPGDTTISLNPADPAALFAASQYVLLFSARPVDFENARKSRRERSSS